MKIGQINKGMDYEKRNNLFVHIVSMVVNFRQRRPSATRFQYNSGHWVAENTFFLLIQSSIYGREFNKLPETCFENMPEETLSVTESTRRVDIDRRREMVFFFVWNASSERVMSRKKNSALCLLVLAWTWKIAKEKWKRLRNEGARVEGSAHPSSIKVNLCRVGWWECEKLLSLLSLSMIWLQWKFYLELFTL